MPVLTEWSGYCPICRRATTFRAEQPWFRDHLLCTTCEGGSIPRERALMLVLDEVAPDWRHLRIHESSPIPRGVSLVLQRECNQYAASQFFLGIPSGSIHGGYRVEDLERQSFPDESLDLVITQDVMEHVFDPERVYREVWRTLVPGGFYIHTTPILKDRMTSERRAALDSEGVAVHLFPPEYHGNPVSDAGALVTFHYGYDLADLIAGWGPWDVEVRRFNDRTHGIVAEFTEVLVCRKPDNDRSPG